jgi:hypothetical protein
MTIKSIWKPLTIRDTICNRWCMERSHEWLYEWSVVKAIFSVHALFLWLQHWRKVVPVIFGCCEAWRVTWQ